MPELDLEPQAASNNHTMKHIALYVHSGRAQTHSIDVARFLNECCVVHYK